MDPRVGLDVAENIKFPVCPVVRNTLSITQKILLLTELYRFAFSSSMVQLLLGRNILSSGTTVTNKERFKNNRSNVQINDFQPYCVIL